jgi:hypothetical protein
MRFFYSIWPLPHPEIWSDVVVWISSCLWGSCKCHHQQHLWTLIDKAWNASQHRIRKIVHWQINIKLIFVCILFLFLELEDVSKMAATCSVAWHCRLTLHEGWELTEKLAKGQIFLMVLLPKRLEVELVHPCPPSWVLGSIIFFIWI